MHTPEHDSPQGSAAWQRYRQTVQAAPSLWSAARSGDVAELERLLGVGADLEARDARGYTALMLAAYGGSLEATVYLLSRGADPNTADLSGNSVLMGAAFKGDLAIVQVLLAAGADHSARNASGFDAAEFAAQFGRHEVAALLQGTRVPRR